PGGDRVRGAHVEGVASLGRRLVEPRAAVGDRVRAGLHRGAPLRAAVPGRLRDEAAPGDRPAAAGRVSSDRLGHGRAPPLLPQANRYFSVTRLTADPDECRGLRGTLRGK